jgi:lysophospholipase L1-like esterase
MAWNRIEGASVADGIGAALGQPVGDVSLPYARITGGRGPLNIPAQVDGLTVPWVVLNGGANDLGVNCARGGDAALEALVSADGRSGAIPQMLRGLTVGGSRVIWADYYTSPQFAGTPCAGVYAEMQARLERMAGTMPAVTLVDMGRVLSPDQAALFDEDRIHPSPAGSRRIAALITEALRAVDPALR